MGTVYANGETISIEEYENNPNRFARQLSSAKATTGHAQCQCKAPYPKLVIRRVSKKQGDTYLLATWPFQGAQHAPQCRFYVPDSQYATGGGPRLPAVQETEDGFSIKPGFSMRRIAAGVKPEPGDVRLEGRDQAIRPQRAALGLLGTLYYLWESAGLNKYTPHSQRNWAEVFSHLNNVIGQGTMGRTKLQDLIYLVPPFQEDLKFTIDQTWQSFTDAKKRTDKTVPMFLVLGEIKDAGPSKWSVSTRLRHHKDPLYMADDLAQAIAKRYPSEDAAIASASPHCKVVGLFLVELSGQGNLTVQNAALMLCSKDYIPCDSSHEAKLANTLASAERAFDKPMFMDGELGLLPDFVERSGREPVYMEVWGMQSPAYLKRKQEKIAAYAEKGLQLWEWHAVSTPVIPRLP